MQPAGSYLGYDGMGTVTVPGVTVLFCVDVVHALQNPRRHKALLFAEARGQLAVNDPLMND